jgi:SNARE domain
MTELAQLFQDLETLVVQQEPAVTQIEQKGEEVTENVGKGNAELDGAIDKARAARRKKWICLGIIGMSKLIELPIVLANLDSRHHYCHHRRCPRCFGSQWYAVRSQVGGCEETQPSKATILESSAYLHGHLLQENDTSNSPKLSNQSQSHIMELGLGPLLQATFSLTFENCMPRLVHSV